MNLYHYTCFHCAPHIEADGHVKSLRDQLEERGLTNLMKSLPDWSQFGWFTDLDTPHANALGLTHKILECDRITHRFRVTDSTDVVSWVAIRRFHPGLWVLEDAPGAMPAHWWLATEPVPVVRS